MYNYTHMYTHWRSWLRHCATSWKVAGSIPVGIIEISYGLKFSGRIRVLGSTQPLTNEYQESSLRDKGDRCVGPTTLPPSRAKCPEILDAENSWTLKGLSRSSFNFTNYTYNFTCVSTQTV